MRANATISKIGRSLVVPLSADIARAAGLRAGMAVELSVDAEKLVVRATDEIPSLADLLKRLKPGSRPHVDDWGPRIGRESW